MKIVSMDVMSAGVIAFYVLIASRQGLFTPIISDVKNIAYADPVPQAVILTAIVIGFSIQALMLVGVMKLALDNPHWKATRLKKIIHHEYHYTSLDCYPIFSRVHHFSSPQTEPTFDIVGDYCFCCLWVAAIYRTITHYNEFTG